jgi:hypothetical protein
MTIYRRWDGFSCLKRCEISKLEHNHTDTCLAWSGDPTNTPQIHSHGVWCDVGRRISNETTICRRGKWIPSFLWNDTEKWTRDDQPCLYSPLYRRPLWSTLNLLVMYMGKYIGNSFGRNDNLPSPGRIYLTSFKPPAGQEGNPRQFGPCEQPYDCVHTKVDPYFFCFGTLKVSESV